MIKVRAEIDARLAEFIAQQHVFFVTTAPLAANGHVNLEAHERGLHGGHGWQGSAG